MATRSGSGASKPLGNGRTREAVGPGALVSSLLKRTTEAASHAATLAGVDGSSTPTAGVSASTQIQPGTGVFGRLAAAKRGRADGETRGRAVVGAASHRSNDSEFSLAARILRDATATANAGPAAAASREKPFDLSQATSAVAPSTGVPDAQAQADGRRVDRPPPRRAALAAAAAMVAKPARISIDSMCIDITDDDGSGDEAVAYVGSSVSKRKRSSGASTLSSPARAQPPRTAPPPPVSRIAAPAKRAVSPAKPTRAVSPGRTGRGRGAAASAARSPPAPSTSGVGRRTGRGAVCTPLERVNKSIRSSEFERIRQLGEAGKEGVTFLVKHKQSGEVAALKQFRGSKASSTLSREAEFQALAASVGAAPAVLGYNLSEKIIVMAVMQATAYDEIRAGRFTADDEAQIVEILRSLDNIRVLHNDRSPVNFMKDEHDVWYAIDYGMSKKMTGEYSNCAPISVAMMLRSWQRMTGLPDAKLASVLPQLVAIASQQSGIPVAGITHTA